MIARVAPLCLWVGHSAAFKEGRSHIVEKHRLIEVKKIPLSLGQRRFDRHPLRMQLVQITVERVFGQVLEIHFQNIRQRRRTDPIRHGQFAAWVNEPIQRHRAGQLSGAFAKASLAENRIHTEPQPELIPHMDRAGFARFLGPDLIDMHRHQVGFCRG